MADGDVTITKKFTYKPGYGGVHEALFQITLVGDYVTGGWDISAITNQIAGTIEQVQLPSSCLGWPLAYDYTLNKILAYETAPGTEMANSDNHLTGQILRIRVIALGS